MRVNKYLKKSLKINSSTKKMILNTFGVKQVLDEVIFVMTCSQIYNEY